MKKYIEKFKIETQVLKDKILKTLFIQKIILWIKTFLILNYRFYFFILHFSFRTFFPNHCLIT